MKGKQQGLKGPGGGRSGLRGHGGGGRCTNEQPGWCSPLWYHSSSGGGGGGGSKYHQHHCSSGGMVVVMVVSLRPCVSTDFPALWEMTKRMQWTGGGVLASNEWCSGTLILYIMYYISLLSWGVRCGASYGATLRSTNSSCKSATAPNGTQSRPHHRPLFPYPAWIKVVSQVLL